MDKAAGDICADRSPIAEGGENKQEHSQNQLIQPQQQQQLEKTLQMLPFNPALPAAAIVLVVESTTIKGFPRRSGGGGGGGAGRAGLGGVGGSGGAAAGGGAGVAAAAAPCASVSSASTSSIGEDQDAAENVDDGNEAESALRDTPAGPLERMETLESSLPLKRGLSQFFDGKSRSFTSLQEVSSAAQLPKPEYQFKRRKIVLHSQMRSRAKSSSNLRKMMMMGRGGDAWTPPTFVSVSSSFLPRSFSLSNVVQQNV